ncbi:hypothetical protein BDN72DRAFT_959332 [Pluteus cervinus]|uniref:Uncharacterized protein n=1 Tax=Pluteus cervinus TaxID=181527 RepID=A0ACD3AVZ1_9AGAR|nr:hypothetical protein BDN72DRAFT_959332 [Pluteus cervinus]
MSSVSRITPSELRATAAARQNIDEEIARLEARIIALKTSRNALSPITCLPQEIIQDIFVLASARAYPSSGTTFGKTSLLISWVCRSWRELAHRASALWSFIDFINPTWVKAALSLTQSRPLDFHLYFLVGYRKDPYELALSCLSNLSRVRTLDIISSAGGLDFFKPPHQLWTNPAAPLLVDLHLHGVSIPSNFLAKAFPALQSLHLASCEFSWESLPLHAGVKHLTIDYPISKVSADELVHKLRALSPNVEGLYFSHILLPTVTNPISIHGLHPAPTRLEFNQLKGFSMNETHAPPVTYILDQLSLPRHREAINIQVLGGLEQFDTVRALVSCRGIEKWPVESLRVGLEDEDITLSIWENWVTGWKDEGEDEVHHLVGTTINFQRFGGLAETIPVFDLLPLSPLRSLTLAGGYFTEHRSDLTDYFNSAHGTIERLNVSIYFIPAFTAMIHQQNQHLREVIGHDQEIKEEEIDDEMKIRLRDLLTFHQLTRLHFDGESEGYYHFTRRYYVVLQEWLMWRKVAGLGLKDLTIADMIVPSSDYLKALYEGVVERFECSGFEEREDEGEAFEFTG